MANAKNYSNGFIEGTFRFRSSHRRYSIRKGAHKNFAKSTRKQLFQSLSIQLVTLSKKGLLHRCFPMNFAKFTRTPFLQNTSG